MVISTRQYGTRHMTSKGGYSVNTNLMVQSAKIISYYTSSWRGGSDCYRLCIYYVMTSKKNVSFLKVPTQ
jgi:hypothetical protein